MSNRVFLLAGAAAVVFLAACQSEPSTPATNVPAPPAAAATPTAATTPAASAIPPAVPVAGPDSVVLRQFVPAGYRILDSATGDLNRDEFPDKLLALDSVQVEGDTFGSESVRPLLVLLGDAQGRFTLAARNDHAVLCSGCGGMMGDPYQGLTIKDGYFSVEHYGGSSWRWTRVITFRYEPTSRRWWLHRDGGETFHSADPDKTETHMKTVRDFGRIRFEQFTGEEANGE